MDALIVKTDSSLTVKDSDGNSLGGMSNINTTGTTTQVSEISLPISCKTFYGNGNISYGYDTPDKFVNAVWAYMNSGNPDNWWGLTAVATAFGYVVEWDSSASNYCARPVTLRFQKVPRDEPSSGYYTKMTIYYADEVDTSSLAYTKIFGLNLPWVYSNVQQTVVTSVTELSATQNTQYLEDISFDGGSIMHKEVPFMNGKSWGDAFKSSTTNRSTLVITVLKCTNTN